MRSLLLAAASLTVLGCGATLPDEETVLLLLDRNDVTAGAVIRATVLNRSDHTVGHGILPCTARIIDASTGESADEPRECILPLILLDGGDASTFSFEAPDRAGDYWIEFDVSDEDRDPPLAGLELRIRSPRFTVEAP
jgi:hypothetical protein